MDRIKMSDEEATPIKNKWRENYSMFVNGSPINPEKKPYQSKVTLMQFTQSIRTAQGLLVTRIVNQQDYYSLDPRASRSEDPKELAPIIKKVLDYYLDSSNFKRHATTFILNALISQGSLYVGWKSRLVQNPEYITQKTEAERRKMEIKISKKVANPTQSQIDVSQEQFAQDLSEELDSFIKEITDDTPIQRKKEIPPYIQVGCLDFIDINPERLYWETNVAYMEDSPWKAFDIDINVYELNRWVETGFITEERLKSIKESIRSNDYRYDNYDILYRNTFNATTHTVNKSKDAGRVKLTFYYGNLVIDQKTKKDNYFCIIANDNILVKEGEYPYWEPPAHKTPIINMAVRQIPFRPTGAGIGDNAVEIQKQLDSNYQMICDTFRYGISGVNILNVANLADRTILNEGISPGSLIAFKAGTVKDNFSRVSLTDKTENQVHPINNLFESALQTNLSVNEMQMGGSNPYSRTSARETEARLEAGNNHVNTVALELETNFMVPVLEKALARVLQFGLNEIETNPELSQLLTEEETEKLRILDANSKLNILNRWYKFKINGFSEAVNKGEAAMRDMELLQTIGSNPVFQPFINVRQLLISLFKNRGVKDLDVLIPPDTEYDNIMAENRLLSSGTMVLVKEAEDHNKHIQFHMTLLNSPYATPEVQEHVMQHQQMMQMMQMNAPQQGGPVPEDI